MSDVESGGDSGQASNSGERGQGGNEQELATKTLHIQHKRFYLDVKQNQRGRFIKVAEIGPAGRKSRLLLSMSAAREFRDHLGSFATAYADLGPLNPETAPEDGKLKSEVIVKENRRYFMDLKENNRGRFLRVSQSFSTGGPRTQIAIPAQGMVEFRDSLTDLLEEFGGPEDEASEEENYMRETLPDPSSLRVDNKKFYFDVGQNRMGVFLRISEVKSSTRTAITIPEHSWARVRDILNQYVDTIPGNNNASNNGSS